MSTDIRKLRLLTTLEVPSHCVVRFVPLEIAAVIVGMCTDAKS
jgi:hypothetical protein